MNQNIKIDPYGFREYDARWLYEKDINSEGITNLGRGLGTQIKNHTCSWPCFFASSGPNSHSYKEPRRSGSLSRAPPA